MAKTIDEYKEEIKAALKKGRRYSSALDLQIFSLASALRTLEMANADIGELKVTTVWEETRYGQKLAPHPVFKIAKDAQDMITRQMKALGLTGDALSEAVEDDPLAKLTKNLAKRRQVPVVIESEDE